MYKHYIRKDESDIIVKAFSDAFEQSEEGDIEVTEDNKGSIYDDLSKGLGDRHFNPTLLDSDDKYIWKYESNIITAQTDDEKYPVADLKTDRKNEVKSTAFTALTKSDWKVIRHRDQVDNSEDTSLTTAEYETLLGKRKVVRDESNTFEGEIDALSTRQNVIDYTWSFTDVPE